MKNWQRGVGLYLVGLCFCALSLVCVLCSTRSVATARERSTLGNTVKTVRVFLESEVDPRPYLKILSDRKDIVGLFFDYTDAVGEATLQVRASPQYLTIGFLDILKAVPPDCDIRDIQCKDGALRFFLPGADVVQGRAIADELVKSRAFSKVLFTPDQTGCWMSCVLES